MTDGSSKNQDYQFFTYDDIKKILDTQGGIQKDVAVATNDLKWIIENYKNQCKEIETLKQTCDLLETTSNGKCSDLKKEIADLKAEVWKIVGIGIGLATAISIFISLFPVIRAFL